MQIQPPAAARFLKYTSHGIGLSKRLIFRFSAPFSPFLTPPASAQFPNLSESVPAFIEALRHRGFSVAQQCLAGRVWELSLNKGSQLMQLMGLQVGLKLQIWPENGGVAVRMSPNLLTRQGIQAAALYIIWAPALLLPAWGLLQQYKLDEEVLQLLTRCLKHRPTQEVR